MIALGSGRRRASPRGKDQEEGQPWPSCPTTQPAARSRRTSGPTTGCWMRCTRSTPLTLARSIRAGPHISRPMGLRATATVRRREPARASTQPASVRGRGAQAAACGADRHRRRAGTGPCSGRPQGGPSPGADHRPPYAHRGEAGGDQGEPADHSGRPRRGAGRPAQPGRPPSVAAGGTCPHRPAGRARAYRQEHGPVADGADGHQRAVAAGQAADRPAGGDQQPPPAVPRRQGVLHPPDRVRHGAGAQDASRR